MAPKTVSIGLVDNHQEP